MIDFSNLTGSLGKVLIVFGLLLAVIGGLLTFGPKIPWIGRLPGDIMIRHENFIFYFPLATCILLSIFLTILFRIFRG